MQLYPTARCCTRLEFSMNFHAKFKSGATDIQAEKVLGQLDTTGSANQRTTTKGLRWYIGPSLQSATWAAANTPSEYQINQGERIVIPFYEKKKSKLLHFNFTFPINKEVFHWPGKKKKNVIKGISC